MSLNQLLSVRLRNGFPRVSGDEPFIINTVYTSGMFSPRERG